MAQTSDLWATKVIDIYDCEKNALETFVGVFICLCVCVCSCQMRRIRLFMTQNLEWLLFSLCFIWLFIFFYSLQYHMESNINSCYVHHILYDELNMQIYKQWHHKCVEKCFYPCLMLFLSSFANEIYTTRLTFRWRICRIFRQKVLFVVLFFCYAYTTNIIKSTTENFHIFSICFFCISIALFLH